MTRSQDEQLREAFLAKMAAEADEQRAFNKMVERGGSPESTARWNRARDRRDAIVDRFATQLGVGFG